ncbi:MOSC domain-containing protein [Aquibacillus kalidii]|uniref:MOSC domain-containing protein n=1 Tax=Aquibacillus kalidii TaxID=2762597 RepID=UPI00164886A8|nr:MOSC domain-containing protein [Aquibacillus kalidii]
MDYQIISLNIGLPKQYKINGKELTTGFIKSAVDTPIWLSKTGFEGDGQADLKNHGGEDKALLMYNHQHYSYWNKKYNRVFKMPSFGENITIMGLGEQEVHLGDRFLLGDAVIQISQPRQPCYKIAEVHQIKDMPAIVTETGFTGYYFRVIHEGYVSPEDHLTLLEQDEHRVSVAYVHQALFHDRTNLSKFKKILKVNSLAETLRASIQKKVEKLERG